MTTIERLWVVLGLFVAGCLVFANGAFAQPAAPALEVTAGYAGFVDDATVSHALVGGLARWPVTPRVSIGPEVTYMRGPGSDRDLFVTGNVAWDLVSRSAQRPGLVVPYVLGGAGFFRHSDRFGPLTFASNEGTFTAGGGARVWVTQRVYIGGEARFGWELHTRVAGTVGVQLGG
ncbi:MAG TPA: hypothetical protein VGQ37_03570 [Vicinamibacterales bacterium]|nr:hypothetical protein [Vicinamibacterales bacterium]